jgi:hypothetical protein
MAHCFRLTTGSIVLSYEVSISTSSFRSVLVESDSEMNLFRYKKTGPIGIRRQFQLDGQTVSE